MKTHMKRIFLVILFFINFINIFGGIEIHKSDKKFGGSIGIPGQYVYFYFDLKDKRSLIVNIQSRIKEDIKIGEPYKITYKFYKGNSIEENWLKNNKCEINFDGTTALCTSG